jgi:hypothetical protein
MGKTSKMKGVRGFVYLKFHDGSYYASEKKHIVPVKERRLM